MARGDGCDLHVGHHRKVRRKSPDQIATDDLRVIEVELESHVRAFHLGDDIGRMLDPGEEIIRAVARVDRLDQ